MACFLVVGCTVPAASATLARPPTATYPPPPQASLGFTRLLAGLDDLALDIPGVAKLMTLFLGKSMPGVAAQCWLPVGC